MHASVTRLLSHLCPRRASAQFLFASSLNIGDHIDEKIFYNYNISLLGALLDFLFLLSGATLSL